MVGLFPFRIKTCDVFLNTAKKHTHPFFPIPLPLKLAYHTYQRR